MEKIFVITIVGPESSGKTTLAQDMAEAIGCAWIPEYAREFLEDLGRPYTFEDLTAIARGQIDLIEKEIGTKQIAGGKEHGAMFNGLRSMGQHQMADLIEGLIPLNSELIIVDSGLLSIRMWAMLKYGKKIDIVEEALQADVTSLYLLTRAGKTWEPDPLREAPKLVDRVWIYNQYLHELARNNLPFRIH